MKRYSVDMGGRPVEDSRCGLFFIVDDIAPLLAQCEAALVEADSEMRDLWWDHPVRIRNREALAALRAAKGGG